MRDVSKHFDLDETNAVWNIGLHGLPCHATEMPASRNLSTGKPLSVTTPRQKAVAIPLQNQNKQPRSLDDDEEASYQVS